MAALSLVFALPTRAITLPSKLSEILHSRTYYGNTSLVLAHCDWSRESKVTLGVLTHPLLSRFRSYDA